jgi:hypothetical protein
VLSLRTLRALAPRRLPTSRLSPRLSAVRNAHSDSFANGSNSAYIEEMAQSWRKVRFSSSLYVPESLPEVQ